MKTETDYFCDPSDHFSCDGLLALLDYIDKWERQTGMRTIMRDLNLSLEFTEYSSAVEAANDYTSPVFDPLVDEDAALLWLKNRTHVVSFDGGVIVSNF